MIDRATGAPEKKTCKKSHKKESSPNSQMVLFGTIRSETLKLKIKLKVKMGDYFKLVATGYAVERVCAPQCHPVDDCCLHYRLIGRYQK